MQISAYPAYNKLVELARLCANQARSTTSKYIAHELWRMAREYQRRASKLDGGKLPEIGSPPFDASE
jgi:hypothetical protein